MTPFVPSATPFEPISSLGDNFEVGTNSLKYPSQPETPAGSDLKRPSSGYHNFTTSPGNSLMTSHIQPEVIVAGPEGHTEDAQIVVDLKKLGVDLDKDVGRSIQKTQDETTEVVKECFNYDVIIL